MKLLLLLALGGCGSDPKAPTPASADAVRALTRASLDLRGVRPSLEEIEQVRADPAALAPLMQGFVQDDRFGLRYAELQAGVWLTPVTESDHTQATYPVPDVLAMLDAIGQEPLRVLARIASEDLPYTELVTGDWTVVNEHLAGFYPTDYPEGGTGWKTVRYLDDRPHVGVLATNGMWWRYDSTEGNANRGRANAISRILLCRDYLEAEIENVRDLDLLDQEAVNEALRTAPACVACHASLDPMASFLWGFYRHFNFSPAEQAHYHPERELEWEEHTGVAPAYHGQPGDTLTDLGGMIARDPRFIECAVERAYEQLLARPAGLEDQDELTRHREAFLESGLVLRALVSSIIQDPAYHSPEPGMARANTARLVSGNLYASQVEDLTGYRFLNEGHDGFSADLYGLRSMAGGLGPGFDTQTIIEPTPTMALTMERIGQAAGWHVARADHDAYQGGDSDSIRLLRRLHWDESPSKNRDRYIAQVQDLYLRVLVQVRAEDDPELLQAVELWAEVEAATGSPVDAWAALIAWMMQQPDFIVY